MFRSSECRETGRRRAPCVIMLGTDPSTRGGISTVVRVYRDTGLFRRLPVEYIPTHRDGGVVVKAITAFLALLRFGVRLATSRVRLVHVHVASHASFWRKYLFIHLAYVFRVPVILHLHGGGFAVFYGDECGDRRRRMIQQTFDRASRVVVLSQSWARWVRGMTANLGIVVVPNPVEIPHRRSDDEREDNTILFLGRIVQQKGVYDLLAAVENLRRSIPDIRLILAGTGELEAVRERAAALGILAHLELPGWVDGEDKVRLFGRASIFVLPSYHEGMPMSILEAMAAGLPVVSTLVGGIPEVVTYGIEGKLVAPGDAVALSAAVEDLLTDRALRSRMGQAAYRRAEREFSADAIVAQLETIYREFGVGVLPQSQAI